MTQKDKRVHKVKVDYGLYDYFKYYKENTDTNISAKEFGEIVKEYNGFIRDSLSKRGNAYNMPCKFGIVELKKNKAEVTINDDGTIKNTLPVNWQETRKLWNDNPDALARRIKIKFVNTHSDGYTFKFIYLRSRAVYTHKSIYRLKFNRLLKRQLSKSIFNNTIDAFIKHY